MNILKYQFRLRRTIESTVLATYVGLSDILREEPIAVLDRQGNCAYKSFERKGYRNWYLEFPDVLFLDLLHHELIRSNTHNVTLGDPDSGDYWQSGEIERYPKSLGNDYEFLEDIGKEITKELTSYLVRLPESEELTVVMLVKWDYKKDFIQVSIKKQTNDE